MRGLVCSLLALGLLVLILSLPLILRESILCILLRIRGIKVHGIWCNHPVRVLSAKMRCHVSEKILKQRHMQCLPTLPIGLLSLLTPKDEYC